MSQVQNDSIAYICAANGFTIEDAVYLANASSQGSGFRIKQNVTRVVKAVSNGSLVLPDMATKEASNLGIIWVINDSPNPIVVYPMAAPTAVDTLNGSTSNTLSITTLRTGIIFLVDSTKLSRSGGYASPTLDWRATLIA